MPKYTFTGSGERVVPFAKGGPVKVSAGDVVEVDDEAWAAEGFVPVEEAPQEAAQPAAGPTGPDTPAPDSTVGENAPEKPASEGAQE